MFECAEMVCSTGQMLMDVGRFCMSAVDFFLAWVSPEGWASSDEKNQVSKESGPKVSTL